MTKLTFSTTIDTPKELVWRKMLEDEVMQVGGRVSGRLVRGDGLEAVSHKCIEGGMPGRSRTVRAHRKRKYSPPIWIR
jgi:hypothetical protein